MLMNDPYQRTLRRCFQTILRSTDQQQLLKDAGTALMQFENVETVWTGLLDQQRNLLETVAVAGAGEEYLGNKDVILKAEPDFPFHSILDLMLNEQSFSAHTFTHEKNIPALQAQLKRWRWQSVFLWQLNQASETIGVIALFSSLFYGFDSDQHELLEEIIDGINLKLTQFSSELYRPLLDPDRETRRPGEGVSNRVLSSLLDRVNDGIVALDRNWCYTYLNETAAKMLQREKPQKLLGKNMWIEYPEGLGEPFHQAYIKAYETQKPVVFEQHYPPWDLWFENRIYPSADGITIYFTEITERKKAQEELRLSHQRLLLHRQNTPMGVIEWNKDFEFHDWNPAAESMFGYTKEEVLGHHISERLLPEKWAGSVDKIWADSFAKKGGTHCIHENVTKYGQNILCEWYNSPLLDEKGKVIGVTSLVHDITKRQKNEENLRHSQKMDAIGKLTGGIAHDFNNMLGVILGFSGLLKQRLSDDEPEIIQYNDHIILAAERAKKLTSNLLEFSRKAPSSTDIVDINSLIIGMKHMLERTLTPRIKLVNKPDGNLWPVLLDRARLEDAILNMCINSMHAMPDGGILTLSTCNNHLSELEVQSRTIGSGDYVLLTIVDTGTGMTQEVRQKIFDPFFTTKGDGGTGLGMSQVYGFVQQSSGDIQVYSELGHGVRIVLCFPRHLGEKVSDKAEENSDSIKELPSGHESILVVDDEPSLLVLTEKILTTSGYTVFCAESSEQALEILKGNSVDLLLSDIIMPNVDGYQLASQVAKLYPKIKIQMVSGFSDNQKIDLVNESLHQRRLSKPLDSHNLLTTVRKLLDD